MTKQIQLLVEKSIAGDKGAYAELCEAIIRDVLYVCVKITGNLHDGEDATQEALVQMGKTIRKLKDPAAFYAWLNRCIHGVCHNYLRREKKQKGRATTGLQEDIMEHHIEFLPAHWAEADETRQIVISALQALPMRQQHLLLMYYFEDMPLKEIAQVLGVTEATARSNLRYARGSLRRSIEKAHGPLHTGALPAIAAVPTLSLIFSKDAARLITEESAHKILLAVGTSLAGGAGAIAAGTQIVTLVAGLAPAALAVILTAGLVLGSSPSPSQPPADPLRASPQQHDALPASGSEGEGDLYIEGSISSPAVAPSSSASTSTSPAESDAAGTISITGSVVMLEANGLETSLPVDLTGICIQAHTGDTLAALAYTNAQGAFALTLPDSTRSYTITVAPNAMPSIGAQGFSYTLAPGETSLPVIPLRDIVAPSCTLSFLAADGGIGTVVSPSSARVNITDATPCTASWAVYAPGGSSLLARGSGTAAPLGGLALAPGRYLVAFTVTDLGGNETTVQKQFVIR